MRSSKKSLFKKVLLILFSATVLEGALFIGSLYISGAFSSIQENAVTLFEQRSQFRAANVQKLLVDDLYKNANYTQLIKDCASLYQSRSTLNGDQAELEEDALNDLLELIRLRTVTGAYIILDKDVFQTSSYPILYLKDSAPNTIYSDNSDISGKYGNATLLKNKNLSLEGSWAPTIQIDTQDSSYDFYTRPTTAAKTQEHLNSQDYGYWGTPITLGDDVQEMITYSIPLIADDGTVFGVIGIDVTTYQLKTQLEYSELSNANQSAYILAKKDGDGFISLVCNGPAYSYLFKEGTRIQLGDEMIEDSYELKVEGSNTIVAHATALNLYNSNTPFEEEDLYLIGICDRADLLRSSDRLARNSYIAISLALIIGIIAAIIISMKFTKPIKKLIYQLTHVNADSTIQLPRVNIDEIDELSTSIEQLSLSLLSAESRLSQVIHALKLPIGAIENFGKDSFYCTEIVSELLDFPKEFHNTNVINKTSLSTALEHFNQRATLLEDHTETVDGKQIQYYVVRYDKNEDTTRWIRFTYSDEKDNQVFIVMDVSKEYIEKEALTYERDHDSLTGLLNRTAFQVSVEKLLRDDIGVAALILWDLDNLKFINDTYGHNCGDLLIQTTANVLSMANQENGITARMAGDEFLIFLHHYPSKQALYKVIQKIHMGVINTKIPLSEDEITKIKVSAGIAWYPDDATDYDTLMKYSDFAMYDVKNSQKGSIRTFDATTYQHNKLLFNGRKELLEMLESNKIRYAFQPIISAQDGSILGFEALMRPQGDILTSPQDVLRLARAQAQLYKVEFMTWTMSIQQFSKINQEFTNSKLFINSIPSIPLLDDLITSLEKSHANILPHVVVELLETDEIEQTYLQIKRDFMKKWHGQFAIDDFGSGYNSDTALLNLNADYMKIDIELIRNIDQDQDRKTMVKNIILIAHQKNILVIAEGVETQEELTTLLALHVDYLQGYFLAKPSFTLQDIPEEKKELIRNYQQELRKGI